ncbi:MAG: winged helix-turn-helix transcriptional regulator [Anaerolineae bacterium]|nr:winged helix-turn-helix transcriptional regulator [Anaerolineae bacterium]
MRELELVHDRVCSALGDPKRLMILYALADGPKCVNDIAAELDTPQPTISRHLKILRDRALVETSRQGTTIFYSLADRRLIDALDLLRGILRDRVLHQATVVAQSGGEPIE